MMRFLATARRQLSWRVMAVAAAGLVLLAAGVIVAAYPAPFTIALASANFTGLAFTARVELRHLRADPGARARRELKRALKRMRPADLWFNRDRRLFYRCPRARRKALVVLDADAVAEVLHEDEGAVTATVLQIVPGLGVLRYTDGLRWRAGAFGEVLRAPAARRRGFWMAVSASPLVVAGEAEIRDAVAGLAGAELISSPG